MEERHFSTATTCVTPPKRRSSSEYRIRSQSCSALERRSLSIVSSLPQASPGIPPDNRCHDPSAQMNARESGEARHGATLRLSSTWAPRSRASGGEGASRASRAQSVTLPTGQLARNPRPAHPRPYSFGSTWIGQQLAGADGGDRRPQVATSSHLLLSMTSRRSRGCGMPSTYGRHNAPVRTGPTRTATMRRAPAVRFMDRLELMFDCEQWGPTRRVGRQCG